MGLGERGIRRERWGQKRVYVDDPVEGKKMIIRQKKGNNAINLPHRAKVDTTQRVCGEAGLG